MVARRMHVTGGLGSVPAIEGFGRDYELDPEAAYAETCAALGCMFWNWQMSLSTAQAPYADLFEWQLYNASAVGMGLDGSSYSYSNPLACRDGASRQAWYEVPCCPSNLSRTWAHLGKYLFSHTRNALWVHQYVGSEATIELHTAVDLEVASALPWEGGVTLYLRPASTAAFTLYLRIPSWTGDYRLAVNGTEMQTAPPSQAAVLPASGYAPQQATYLPISRTWSPGDLVEIAFTMPLTVRRPHPRVSSLRGKVALTRGPLVYCLESVDNPALDLFDTPLDTASLKPENRPELLGGVWVLRGQTTRGDPLTAIPYYAWANRGPSQMVVWTKEAPHH
jgi:hypothetical protein